ncbi:hypothetical protein [Marinactinospora rubrisoli]|uniref:Uncharacterized protein n=1 Tax=Marinactinospora rubrisoli TaxID=2715399 RepID=A0ABW2KIL9_9ACTN
MRDDGLVGRWSSASLELGAMEAGTIGFRPDGTGWYELANVHSSSVDRFGWSTPGPGRLRLRVLRSLELDWSGAPAPAPRTRPDPAGPHGPLGPRPQLSSDERLDSAWESSYRVGTGLDVAGAAVTVLVFDRPFGFDARFALVSRDVTPGDDPTERLAPRG